MIHIFQMELETQPGGLIALRFNYVKKKREDVLHVFLFVHYLQVMLPYESNWQGNNKVYKNIRLITV